MPNKYPLFLQAMGSSLDKGPIKALARNPEYGSVITGPYGMSKLKQLGLLSKGIAMLNPFVQTRRESKPYDIYPAPGMITEKDIKLWWSKDYYAYGYPMTMEWAETFAEAVVQYIETENPLGIMLDDWKRHHRWWDMSEADYQLMHPTDLPMILEHIERKISEALWDRPQGGTLLVNGDFQRRSTTLRFWEGFGRPYNPIMRVFKGAKPGDYIQVNEPSVKNKFMVGFLMGKKKHNPICISVPDGKRLVEDGLLQVPTPKEYPWR